MPYGQDSNWTWKSQGFFKGRLGLGIMEKILHVEQDQLQLK